MRKQKEDRCGHFNKIQLSSERKLLRHHGKIDHESAVCPLQTKQIITGEINGFWKFLT